MSYIYKITNDINDRVYIGKTNQTVAKRFLYHIRDSKKENIQHRPLYLAMNKYGVEHFKVEEIEECFPEDCDERERYWIEYYGSFKNGYNATIGGDGKPYIDYDLVVATYNETLSIAETARKLSIHKDTVGDILRNKKIQALKNTEVLTNKYGQVINQYDLQGKFIQSFPSVGSAVHYLGKDTNKASIGGAKSHITDVCKGKRKTAYGYIWKYALN